MNLGLRSVVVALFFAACAQTVAVGPVGPLLINLGFERGDDSWDSWGESEVRDEYYGVKPHEGQKFLRMWSRSGRYQDFPTQKGNSYSVEAWVNTSSDDPLRGDAFGELKVEWRTKSANGDADLGQPTSMKFDTLGKAGTTIPSSTWSKISIPAVQAPAGATHGRVLVTIYTEGGDKGGGCALFDDLSIRQETRPVPPSPATPSKKDKRP